MIATSDIAILEFLLRGGARRKQGTLVTLTGIIGSSPRALGAQMAVATDGSFAGSLSGGCLEAAIVAEALAAHSARCPRLVRFGAGSPFIDIRLPCGGGLDLLFNPAPEPQALEGVIRSLRDRQPAALALSLAAPFAQQAPPGKPAGWKKGAFLRPYRPPLRIVALGEGEDLAALVRLAAAFGTETIALTPDRLITERLRCEGHEVVLLETNDRRPGLIGDDRTAIVSLFHDREWEEALLPWLLRLPVFYVGAVGSRRRHEMRYKMLRRQMPHEDVAARLRMSVGTIPAARDPSTLALSILAQIVAVDAASAVGERAAQDAGDLPNQSIGAH